MACSGLLAYCSTQQQGRRSLWGVVPSRVLLLVSLSMVWAIWFALDTKARAGRDPDTRTVGLSSTAIAIGERE